MEGVISVSLSTTDFLIYADDPGVKDRVLATTTRVSNSDTAVMLVPYGSSHTHLRFNGPMAGLLFERASYFDLSTLHSNPRTIAQTIVAGCSVIAVPREASSIDLFIDRSLAVSFVTTCNDLLGTAVR